MDSTQTTSGIAETSKKIEAKLLELRNVASRRISQALKSRLQKRELHVESAISLLSKIELDQSILADNEIYFDSKTRSIIAPGIGSLSVVKNLRNSKTYKVETTQDKEYHSSTTPVSRAIAKRVGDILKKAEEAVKVYEAGLDSFRIMNSVVALHPAADGRPTLNFNLGKFRISLDETSKKTTVSRDDRKEVTRENVTAIDNIIKFIDGATGTGRARNLHTLISQEPSILDFRNIHKENIFHILVRQKRLEEFTALVSMVNQPSLLPEPTMDSPARPLLSPYSTEHTQGGAGVVGGSEFALSNPMLAHLTLSTSPASHLGAASSSSRDDHTSPDWISPIIRKRLNGLLNQDISGLNPWELAIAIAGNPRNLELVTTSIKKTLDSGEDVSINFYKINNLDLLKDIIPDFNTSHEILELPDGVDDLQNLAYTLLQELKSSTKLNNIILQLQSLSKDKIFSGPASYFLKRIMPSAEAIGHDEETIQGASDFIKGASDFIKGAQFLNKTLDGDAPADKLKETYEESLKIAKRLGVLPSFRNIVEDPSNHDLVNQGLLFLRTHFLLGENYQPHVSTDNLEKCLSEAVNSSEDLARVLVETRIGFPSPSGSHSLLDVAIRSKAPNRLKILDKILTLDESGGVLASLLDTGLNFLAQYPNDGNDEVFEFLLKKYYDYNKKVEKDGISKISSLRNPAEQINALAGRLLPDNDMELPISGFLIKRTSDALHYFKVASVASLDPFRGPASRVGASRGPTSRVGASKGPTELTGDDLTGEFEKIKTLLLKKYHDDNKDNILTPISGLQPSFAALDSLTMALLKHTELPLVLSSFIIRDNGKGVLHYFERSTYGDTEIIGDDLLEKFEEIATEIHAELEISFDREEALAKFEATKPPSEIVAVSAVAMLRNQEMVSIRDRPMLVFTEGVERGVVEEQLAQAVIWKALETVSLFLGDGANTPENMTKAIRLFALRQKIEKRLSEVPEGEVLVYDEELGFTEMKEDLVGKDQEVIEHSNQAFEIICWKSKKTPKDGGLIFLELLDQLGLDRRDQITARQVIEKPILANLYNAIKDISGSRGGNTIVTRDGHIEVHHRQTDYLNLYHFDGQVVKDCLMHNGHLFYGNSSITSDTPDLEIFRRLDGIHRASGFEKEGGGDLTIPERVFQKAIKLVEARVEAGVEAGVEAEVESTMGSHAAAVRARQRGAGAGAGAQAGGGAAHFY